LISKSFATSVTSKIQPRIVLASEISDPTTGNKLKRERQREPILVGMTIARRHIATPDVAGAYHVVTRCVRRAWLCGRDALTGRDFSHRKRWIEERIFVLAEHFAIGVYAYAVMSNHVHLVVRTKPVLVNDWDALDVLRRWFSVCRGKNDTAASIERRASAAVGNDTLIAEYRQRLGSLSWFMRFLNESIARAANAEDGCKGRFWEGRFRCQALLDDAAVLSAMTYVDLNPVRARIVAAPEAAEQVSFRHRSDRVRSERTADERLAPVTGVGMALAVSEGEYLKLVDQTGRRLHPDKPGAIEQSLPPIVQRLGLSQNGWLLQVQGTESRYWRAIGLADALIDRAGELGQRWLKGVLFARRLKTA
jgi:REP element-mobilizing transposase RayT